MDPNRSQTPHALPSGSGGGAEEAPAGRPGAPVDPIRVLRRVRKGLPWLIGIAVIGAAIGVVWAKFFLAKSYEAQAVLQYEGHPPVEGVPTPASADAGATLQSLYLESVLAQIRDRLELGQRNSVIAARIVAAADMDQVVRITGTGSSAEEAAIFTNGVVEVFLEHQLEVRRGQFERAIADARERLTAAEATLETAQERHDAFRQEHGVSNLTTEQEASIEEAAELRADRDRASSEISALEARVEQLRRDLRRTSRTSVTSSSVMNTDADELQRLESELAQLRATLAEDHPQVLTLQRRIDSLRARIASGESTKVRNTVTGTSNQYSALQSALSSAEADLQAARQWLEGLTRLADEAQERVNQFSSIEGDATQLLAEVRVNERLVSDLRTRLAQFEDAARSPTTGYRIMSEATPPEYAKGNKKKYLIAGGVPAGGMFVCFVILMLLEFRGLRVRTARETAWWGKGPVIGSSTWPTEMEALDDLVADLDDFVPEAQGRLLLVAGHPAMQEYARQLAERLSSDWYDTTVVGGPSFMMDEDPRLSLPAGGGPGAPGGGAPEGPGSALAVRGAQALSTRSHHLEFEDQALLLQVEAWEGADSGPSLRRAARLADRVCVLVPAGTSSFLELAKTKERLGRDDVGVGYLLIDLDPQYATLLDRVGPVEAFWASQRS